MDLRAHFHDLFRYHDEANRHLIPTLQQNPYLPDSVHKLFSHILNAQHNWLVRIGENGPERPPFERLSPAHYLAEHERTLDVTLQRLDSDDLERVVTYQNSRGDRYGNSVREIFTQLINHATHHRAQIQTSLRMSNLTPQPLDYIFFRRHAQ